MWKRSFDLKKKGSTGIFLLDIGVDRFLKRSVSLDWFSKTLSLDKFLIGGIGMQLNLP